MKKGFSLIELMIVIVIIGVVYTLAITKLKTVGEEKVKPSLANLKEYLLSVDKEAEETRFLCLDDCSECSVYTDGKKVQSMKSFFDSSIETYTYNFLQGTNEVKDALFFNKEGNEENVCFSLNVTKDGIADQYLVVYKDKTYDYTLAFEKTKVYDFLEEAVEAKQKMAQEVMQ